MIHTSGYPVGWGLVHCSAHQQVNVTGLSKQAAELEGKRLELVNELIPDVSRVVVLSNPGNPYCTVAVEQARRAAAILHVKLDVVEIGYERELDDAFRSMTRFRPNAILVVADPFLASQQTRIAAFLVQAKIPSIYTYREQVTAGGPLFYSPKYPQLFLPAAFIPAKIPKRFKPAPLPLQPPAHI